MDIIWYVICFGLSFGIYANTFKADFVYDDRKAILTNDDVDSSLNVFINLWRNDFWGTEISSDNSHGSYRPLCVLTFRLTHWLFGYKAHIYHITNVLLHCTTSTLVLKIGQKILPDQTAAVVAGLLFSSQPIHTEAVASIVGRADIIACIFYLLAIANYLNYCKVIDKCTTDNNNCIVSIIIIWTALSTISKEIGFSALPVCICCEIVRYYKQSKMKSNNRLKALKVLIVSSGLLLFIRMKIIGIGGSNFSTADNPTAKETNFLTRFLTFFYLPVFNFMLLLCPQTLSYDWSMDSIPKISSVSDSRNILSIIFYIVIFFILKTSFQRQQQKLSNRNFGKKYVNFDPVFLSSIMIIIPFLPASNLFFYVGFVVAERILYIPSVGFCFLIGFGYHLLELKKFGKIFGRTFMTFIIVLFSIRTILRNEDWMTEERLYKSGIQINPPKSFGNLGCILSNQGKLKEAEVAFKSALKYRFNMAEVHHNLGLLQEKMEHYEAAVSSFEYAIKFRQTFAVAYLKLGLLLLNKLNRAEYGKMMLIRCSKLDLTGLKDYKIHNIAKMEALINLARIYQKNDSYAEVLAAFEQAVSLVRSDSQLHVLYGMIGETLMNMKRFEDAEIFFTTVFGIQRQMKENSKISIFQNNYSKPIYGQQLLWFKNLPIRSGSENLNLLLQYAELLYNKFRYEESAKIYKKTVSLLPNDFQLTGQTAYVCRKAGLWNDAEFFYTRAIQLQPQNANSYKYLAVLLHIRGKYGKAKLAYESSLKLNPDDPVTKLNYETLRNKILKTNA